MNILKLEVEPFKLADAIIATELKSIIGLITNYELFQYVGKPFDFTLQSESETIADKHTFKKPIEMELINSSNWKCQQRILSFESNYQLIKLL